MSGLFDCIKAKNLEIRNRIVMPPMCMYSSDENGIANDWHFTHYETRAIGGVGLILLEATAVESRGRISGKDLGIWDDSHIKGLQAIISNVKKHGAKIGIQLAHAGRKCMALNEDVIAPSSICFDETDKSYVIPREMTKEDIKQVVESFKNAAIRADASGFDLIEIHCAHGYLINEFLSPVTNQRTDEFGGTIENRSRLLKEILSEVTTVWPQDKPILIRVSATDYHEEGNTPEEIGAIINLIKHLGIDLIDVSSGGLLPAPVNAFEGYQIKFAEIVKSVTGTPVIAGGKIVSSGMANEVIQNERADMVFIGRELLRNPYWPLKASRELNQEINYWPFQYERSK